VNEMQYSLGIPPSLTVKSKWKLSALLHWPLLVCLDQSTKISFKIPAGNSAA
jgi:hypothetical protein